MEEAFFPPRDFFLHLGCVARDFSPLRKRSPSRAWFLVPQATPSQCFQPSTRGNAGAQVARATEGERESTGGPSGGQGSALGSLNDKRRSAVCHSCVQQRLGGPRPKGKLSQRCRRAKLDISRGTLEGLPRSFADTSRGRARGPAARKRMETFTVQRLLAWLHDSHRIRGRAAASLAREALRICLQTTAVPSDDVQHPQPQTLHRKRVKALELTLFHSLQIGHAH